MANSSASGLCPGAAPLKAEALPKAWGDPAEMQKDSKIFKDNQVMKTFKTPHAKGFKAWSLFRWFLQRFTCIPQTQFPHCGPPLSSQTMSNLWMEWWIHGRTDGWMTLDDPTAWPLVSQTCFAGQSSLPTNGDLPDSTSRRVVGVICLIL